MNNESKLPLFKHKRHLAIHMDNGEAWLNIDFHATQLGWVIVPVPHFFSVKQIQYMVEQAGIDTVCCGESHLNWWQSLGFDGDEISAGVFCLTRDNALEVSLPEGTHKITFTSGTTDEPKGVCLSQHHLNTVGQSLSQATAHLGITKHISLLPYSVLLENMATSYATDHFDNKTMQPIEVVSLPLSDVGLTGSGQFDVKVMLAAITKHQADSMIMMPQMLKQLVAYLMEHNQDLSFVKFIAVGGAVCSAKLIRQAHELGLPVYQGYGISECGSVICLNNTHEALESVGVPLPHCDVVLAEDGEIKVIGSQFLGYLGMKPNNQSGAFCTGDIGCLDTQGRLQITGRKKHVIINSFGRNILPDWIEGEILTVPMIHQAVVFGDAQPTLTALCVTELEQHELQVAVDQLNQNLPDYAQIKTVIKVAPFTVTNGLLTPSGKLKRSAIFKQYQQILESIYDSSIETTTAIGF